MLDLLALFVSFRLVEAVGVDDKRTVLNCVLNTALCFDMESNSPPPLFAFFDEQDDDIPFGVNPLPTTPRVTSRR